MSIFWVMSYSEVNKVACNKNPDIKKETVY